jgi:septal ring factor EnvC (AmiA/AmiB activator)
MCKKLVLATLAVLVALVVVKRTWVGSHVRAWWHRTCEQVRGSVDPETEIQRLRYEIKRLEEKDKVFVDRVARQKVEVDDSAAELKKSKERLTLLRDRISKLRLALAESGDAQPIAYNSNNYSRAEAEKQIDRDFDAYKTLKKDVESQDRYLTVLRKALQQNEEQLSSFRRNRLDMLTQLRDLENELTQLRQAKKKEPSVREDGKYRRLQQDIQRLKQQLRIDKEKLRLDGVIDRGPIEEAEEARDRKAARQRELDTEFPVRPVAGK